MRNPNCMALFLFASAAYAQQPAYTLNWSHTATG